MYCPKCGKLFTPNGSFCPNCGCKIDINNGFLNSVTPQSPLNNSSQSSNAPYINNQYVNPSAYANSPHSNSIKGNNSSTGIIIGVSTVLIVLFLFFVVVLMSDVDSTSDSSSVSHSNDNEESISDESQTSYIRDDGRTDLYYVRTLSESKLVKEFDYFKNDFHFYPDTHNIVIMYLDGDINIVIDEDYGDEYCFSGLCIGDPMDSVKSCVSGRFKLINRYHSADGTLFRLYEDKEHDNGYLRIKGRETVISIFYFETDEDMTDKEVW